MKQIFFYSCCISLIYCLQTETLLASPSCTKEELMKFFPQPIVMNVLVTDAHLSEKDAEAISKELAIKDNSLTQLVDEKASQQKPNPFNDSSQRDKAIKIYQETLFEVFAKVLKEHGINDEQQMRSLLDEIRTLKSKMFIECIRQQQKPVKSP